MLVVHSAYSEARNRLVIIVRENRLWNRVGLHQRAYTMLQPTTVLGSQMVCNAIFAVCKAYKAQKELGRIKRDAKVSAIKFNKARKGNGFLISQLNLMTSPLLLPAWCLVWDVGENNLAAISLSKVFACEDLRDKRDRHLTLCRLSSPTAVKAPKKA